MGTILQDIHQFLPNIVSVKAICQNVPIYAMWHIRISNPQLSKLRYQYSEAPKNLLI